MWTTESKVNLQQISNFHHLLIDQKAHIFPSMGCTDYRLQMNGKSTVIGVFCHLDCIDFLTFIDTFTTYVEMIILKKQILIPLCDFTIHINILDDPKVSTIRQLQRCFGLSYLSFHE